MCFMYIIIGMSLWFEHFLSNRPINSFFYSLFYFVNIFCNIEKKQNNIINDKYIIIRNVIFEYTLIYYLISSKTLNIAFYIYILIRESLITTSDN